ncbi:hypothetical protein [Parasulfitobacter algicola]|uniref:AAA+ family ATPase n=1 Tax=Parasulfitobacter algicola TaxID=2614809 RepID=A0ABX2IZ70_9RHOB|nr:hypothetical protein [Sulfitobacter algicola]NSX56512.1 hypothetical protein [Sulfitobacter algicola]
MKQTVAAFLITALCTAPLAAQDAEPEQGLSLMERGMQMFFQGLAQEMEPAMEDLKDLAGELEPALRAFAMEMGPALQDLSNLIDDATNYEAPAILPNGDIIIRRKPDAPVPQSGTDEIEI